MKETNPAVSVVMPVYNGMPYLPHAVNSILKQTFQNLELIVINDSSSDGSLDYLSSLTDDRLVLVNISKNVGVARALRAGVARARGIYIARLDQDDIARHDRLQKQYEYLEQKPAVGIVGSSYELLDESGNCLKKVSLGGNDLDIRWKMMFKNPFIHSSIMIRSSLLQQYQLTYPDSIGEDYLLWIQIMKYAEGYIFDLPLIQYRRHQGSDSSLKHSQYAREAVKISTQLLTELYRKNNHIDWIEFNRWARNPSGSKENKPLFVSVYLDILAAFITKHKSKSGIKIFKKSKLRHLKRRVPAHLFYSLNTLKFLINTI